MNVDMEVGVAAIRLAKQLQILSLRLTDTFVTADGKKVSYKRMRRSAELQEYIELSAQLEHIRSADLISMTDSQKLAFFANLYNALIIHANCVIGPPVDSPSARSEFFSGRSGAKYCIAGLLFSPDDVEHCVIRANRLHPSQVVSSRDVTDPNAPSGYLPTTDPRVQYAIRRDAFDFRIHFILNCGAASCPPIKVFDESNLEAALATSAKIYLQSQVDVVIREQQVKAMLPKLLLWYAIDFGGDDKFQVLLNVLKMLTYDTGAEVISDSSSSNSSSNSLSMIIARLWCLLSNSKAQYQGLADSSVLSSLSFEVSLLQRAGDVIGDVQLTDERCVVDYFAYDWTTNDE